MNGYYLMRGDEVQGPLTIGQLRSMWNSGIVNMETLYAEEGYSEWLPLKAMRAKLETQVPPPPPPPANPNLIRVEDANASRFLGKPGTGYRALNVGCAALIIGILAIVLAGAAMGGCR